MAPPYTYRRASISGAIASIQPEVYRRTFSTLSFTCMGQNAGAFCPWRLHLVMFASYNFSQQNVSDHWAAMIYLLVRIRARRSRHSHKNALQIRVDSSCVGTNIFFARNMKKLKGNDRPGIFTIRMASFPCSCWCSIKRFNGSCTIVVSKKMNIRFVAMQNKWWYVLSAIFSCLCAQTFLCEVHRGTTPFSFFPYGVGMAVFWTSSVRHPWKTINCFIHSCYHPDGV